MSVNTNIMRFIYFHLLSRNLISRKLQVWIQILLELFVFY